MPSFDVVSKTDLMEVDNAVNGVRREIQTRFDLKGKNNEINRDDNTLTMTANDAMMLRQLEELLRSYLVRRKLDTDAFDFQKARIGCARPESAKTGHSAGSEYPWPMPHRRDDGRP